MSTTSSFRNYSVALEIYMVVAFRDGLRSDTKKTLFRRVELHACDLLTNIELIVNIIIPDQGGGGGQVIR